MNEVEEIKHRLDLIDFIGQYLTLKKAGSNWKALCPFHQEKTPSFMVSKDKQIYKCFGCSEGGDIFDFVMKMEGLDFREALELLAGRAGVNLPLRRQIRANNYVADFSEGPSLKNKFYEINDLAARLWQKILIDHPVGKKARDYLIKRKIDEKTIKSFALGYAPDKWTLTMEFLKKHHFQESEIAGTGILVKKENSGYYDRFRGRLIFPIKNTMGKIVGFTARVLSGDPNLPNDPNIPKYINSSDSLIYNKSRILYGLDTAKLSIKKENKVVVVEGNMDVIRSQTNGFEYTVASSGTALTEDHLKILNRFTSNILIAFDADAAGEIATERIIELALNTETSLKIIQTPKGFKDADEVISKDPKLWQKAIDAALPVIEYYFEMTTKEYKGEQGGTMGNEGKRDKGYGLGGEMTVETKKKISKKLLPLIARINDPIEKAHYLQMLGKKLNVPENSLRDAIAKSQIPNPKSQTNPKSQIINPKSAILPPNEHLLGLLTAYPEHQQKYPELYKQLKNGYNKNIDTLVFAIKREGEKESEEEITREIEESVRRLGEKDREKIKIDFANRIKTAEEAGDRKEVQRLILELQKLI